MRFLCCHSSLWFEEMESNTGSLLSFGASCVVSRFFAVSLDSDGNHGGGAFLHLVYGRQRDCFAFPPHPSNDLNGVLF